MSYRADHCGFKLSTGKVLHVWKDQGVISWHCRNEDLKSNESLGNIVQIDGGDYELYASAQLVGTIRNFRLEQVDTERTYQVVVHGHSHGRASTLAVVCYVELDGKNLCPILRVPVLPEGANMQTAGTVVSGIGDPGFVKGVRR